MGNAIGHYRNMRDKIMYDDYEESEEEKIYFRILFSMSCVTWAVVLIMAYLDMIRIIPR